MLAGKQSGNTQIALEFKFVGLLSDEVTNVVKKLNRVKHKKYQANTFGIQKHTQPDRHLYYFTVLCVGLIAACYYRGLRRTKDLHGISCIAVVL